MCRERKGELVRIAASELVRKVSVSRKSMIKHLLHSTLGAFGDLLSRLNAAAQPTHGLAPFFGLIQRNGLRPKHLVDAGANHGTWTREALKFFPDADYTLIE